MSLLDSDRGPNRRKSAWSMQQLACPVGLIATHPAIAIGMLFAGDRHAIRCRIGRAATIAPRVADVGPRIFLGTEPDMPVPLATYRVQMHAGFGFDAAAAIADYLRDLGVTHLYCSPYLQAGKGSTHGYDVLDHSKPNAELGGAEAHARLCQALGEAGLGQILDIVPNHMSIASRDNKWWWDVLENGQSSRYAGYFDVDWQPPEAKLRDTVLMPILGDHYGREVEAGHVQLERDRRDVHVPLLRPRHARRPPVAQRPAQRGRLAGRLRRAGVPGRLVRQPADLDRDRLRERLAGGTATRKSSASALARLCSEKPEVGPAIDARDRRDQRLARPRSTPSSNGRITGWPSGRPPSRSWTIAGSSTSTR